MAEFEDRSISNSISKGSLFEDDTFAGAAMEEILSEAYRAISDEQIQNGTRIRDTYQIISDAIPGGMGEVWKVHHDTWNVDLAMKRPKPLFFSEGGLSKKRAFIKECENWITLGLHPNIVSCYYVREVGGVPSVFSEWMNLGSLKDCIKSGTLYQGEEKAVDERILDIAVQSAWGLSYSHENKLVHQDVKPGNILISDGWEAKVADFGLAQAAAAAAIGPQSLGYSLGYCPAEQVEGKNVQPWMDIYSWAVTVLEMYAEGRKWDTGAQVKKEYEQILEKISRVIPEGMSALLEKCIRSGPELAFSDVTKELEQIYTQVTQHAYPRLHPRAAGNSADSLNNYALSYYDLGRKEKALELLQEAFRKDSRCLPAVYNTALLGYRQGLLDDLAAVARVKELVSPSMGSSEGGLGSEALLALARIQAECRDSDLTETLDKLDQSFPGGNDPERSSMREEISQNRVKEIFEYKNPGSGMVEISPDGALLAVHHSAMQKTDSVQFLRAADLKECSTVIRFPDTFEPAEAKIRISRDHQYCFGTYMKDPYVYRWRIADGSQTTAMVMRKLPGETISAYDFDETGTNAVFASNRGRLVFRDNESGQAKAAAAVSGSFTVAMSSDGSCGLVSLYEQDKVLLHGFRDERFLEIGVRKPAYSAFVLKDDYILTISEDVPPRLCLYDAATGECLFETPFPRYSEFTGRQRQISVSCDGSRVLFSINSGFLIFSVSDRRWLFTLSEKDTGVHRNLVVKGDLVGDGNLIYLSTFNNQMKGYKLPEFEERSPWLLSRIKSARINLEEEDQFGRLCADALSALRASDIKAALRCLKDAGEVGDGKFKTTLSYRDLVKKVSPDCSILKLQRPYAVDLHPVFRAPVFSMSVSPDGKWICALSEEGEMAVLDADTCGIVYHDRFRRHAHMRKAQWTGRTFYSIVIGESRSSFSKEGDRRLKMDNGNKSGGSMGISFQGLDLAGSRGGQVYAFDMEKLSSFDKLKPFMEGNDITDILAAENGAVFYCRRDQGEIFRYREGTGKMHLFFSGEDYQITGSAISPDGSTALQSLGDILNFKKEETASSLAFLYDTGTGKIRLTSTRTGATAACSFTDDGKYAIVGNCIFNLSDGSMRQFAYSSSCFVNILENKYLTALGTNNLLRAYDLDTGTLLLEAEVDENPVSLACSPDRNTLYIGNKKGEISLWCWDHIYQPQERKKTVSVPQETGTPEKAAETVTPETAAETGAPDKAAETEPEKPVKTSFWKRLFGKS